MFVTPEKILFSYPTEVEILDKSTLIPTLCIHFSFHHGFEKVDKTNYLILVL